MEQFTKNKLSSFLKEYGFELVKIVNNDSLGQRFYAEFRKGNLFLTLEKSFYRPDNQELLIMLCDASVDLEGMSNCCSTYCIIRFKYRKPVTTYLDEPSELLHSFDLIIHDLENYCRDFLEGDEEAFRETLLTVLKLRGG